MKSISAAMVHAFTAVNTQQWIERSGIKLSPAAWPIVTVEETTFIKNLTIHANTISRNATAVQSWKYGIRPAGSDFDFIAPQGTPAELIETDTLGAFPLLFILAAGVVLVSGVWAVSYGLDAGAKKQTALLSEKILNADREMLSSPDPAIRAAWIERKKIEQQNIEVLNKQTGFLTDVFGAKGGSMITLAIIGAVVFAGLSLAKKARADAT